MNTCKKRFIKEKLVRQPGAVIGNQTRDPWFPKTNGILERFFTEDFKRYYLFLKFNLLYSDLLQKIK